MKVIVIGAGAGGAAAVADLTLMGHEVTLWGRSGETVSPFQERGGVAFDGVLGQGLARLSLITTEIRRAIADVDAAVVTLPTFSHASVAKMLAQADWPHDKPIILNPGHTGGALEFAEAFRSVRSPLPPLAEFSTLTYVARKYRPDTVTVTGRAKQVRAAALPGGDLALVAAGKLFPGTSAVADVLAADLANVNMVLHPPGAVLSAAWVEARGGDFTFYVDAMTPCVTRVMRQLDDERRNLALAFGHDLPNLIAEMKLVGTVAEEADLEDFAAAIAGGEANRLIKGPDSLEHRYYREDFGHGLLPFLDLAAIAGVKAPAAQALFTLAQSMCGVDFRANGRTAERMGIAGLSKSALLDKVRAA